MGAGKDFLKPEYVHRVNGRAWDKGPANWQLRTGVALVGILAFVVYPLYRAGARMEVRVAVPSWVLPRVGRIRRDDGGAVRPRDGPPTAALPLPAASPPASRPLQQRAVAVESPTWYASSQPVAKERDLSLGETAAE